MNDNIGGNDFGIATQTFVQYWTGELCDYYLEAVKPILYSKNPKLIGATKTTLFYAIESGLRLLHPLMPYITEELYQKLWYIVKDQPNNSTILQKSESISIAKYPMFIEEHEDKEVEQEFQLIVRIVKAIRELKGSVNLAPSIKPEVFGVFLEKN